MIVMDSLDQYEENRRKKIRVRVLVTAGAFLVVLIVLIPVLVLCLRSSDTEQPPGPVMVIDQDGGADDAMAIFIALLREKYFEGPKVIGITTVHGNVDEDQVFNNTQRILDVAGRQDIPIYRGTTSALVISVASDYFFGKDGLGDNKTVEYKEMEAEPQHAVFSLIDLSKKYEGNLVIVALAPLTNIAMAQKIDPQFMSRLKHLYVGAGNVYDASYADVEFNAQLDVEAYHVVAESATPDKVTILPFSQVKQSINTTRKWRQNTLGSIKTKIIQAQNTFEQVSIVQSALWHLLDPIVMSTIYAKDMVTFTRLSNNSIILCGSSRGINTNNFSSTEPNVNIISSLSQTVFEQFLLQTFSAK